MRIPSVNIIGAGHVGQTLACLGHRYQAIQVVNICNRSLDSANNAVSFIGSGQAVTQLTAFNDADQYWLGCGDDDISTVCEQLAKTSNLRGKVVLHFSGVHTTDMLAAAKACGAWVASVHPIHSFAHPKVSLETFVGSYCALQGDPEALEQIQPILQSIGARFFTLQAKDKALHHASGAFANNFIIALAQASMQCYAQTEVDPQIAKILTLQLMQQAVDNLTHSSLPLNALSGPLKRGNTGTIAQHLQALPGAEKKVYQALASYLLAELDHPQGLHDKLTHLLDEQAK